MMTQGVHSLLSGEGIRWFFATFDSMLGSRWLVWLLLLAMAGGCFYKSGIWRSRAEDNSHIVRRGRGMALLLLTVYIGVLFLLTSVPHAVLLSATGSLWPSPFSRALLPLLAFIVIAVSAFYGIMAGHFANLSNVYDALLDGIRQGATLFLFYLLIVQLYLSAYYIINL
jgi:aminobenzoyl-glutamate transport protein